MWFFSQCLVPALLGVHLASALPQQMPRAATDDTDGGSFSIAQVRNVNYQRNGAISYYKALRKFGAPIPPHVHDAVHKLRVKRATGSAAAIPEPSDVEFLTPVSIGTPPQKLNLDIDSGSGDLWVFSSSLPSDQVQGQTVFNPNKSSTATKMAGGSWDIGYGDGSSSSGDVYKDVVTIGRLSVTGQAVECAKKVSSQFTSDTNNDGIVGLGFSNINTVQPAMQKTFFENAMSSLDKPVWTADLKAGAAGKYNFGYIDSAAHTSDITYVDVDPSQGYWQFDSTGFAVGSAAINKTTLTGIADTGTTIMLADDNLVRTYYSKLKGATYDEQQAGWVFPCSATPPDLSLEMGQRLTIPGKYLNYAPAGPDTCYGGLQSNTGIGFSIYGDIALKAWFVVFDGGKTRIGFASKKL